MVCSRLVRSAQPNGPYQISSWATRFMRSAAVVLSSFCAMAPAVSANPNPRAPALDSGTLVVVRLLGDRLVGHT